MKLLLILGCTFSLNAGFARLPAKPLGKSPFHSAKRLGKTRISRTGIRPVRKAKL